MSKQDKIQEHDKQVLHKMGYAQELSRRMSGFSNFAISFSIICILAGGITAFPFAFSATGGGGVGVGWLVGGIFALIVSVAMGQIASSYPTAGGLYHWSSILGGRAWGWVTAWFNVLGLVFVISSVDAGVFQLFRDLVLGGVFHMDVSGAAWQATSGLPGLIWLAGVGLIIVTHAALNHFGIRLTTVLTDISGYLIFIVAITLTISLLVFSPVALDFSRLWTFTNFSGEAGGSVIPQTNSILYGFVVGLILVVYTITGYDASAHTSEETHDAQINVPKGMWQAVFYSMIFGFFMVCSFVLTMPDMAEGASKGWGVIAYIMSSSKMPSPLLDLLYVGIVFANYLCGLACVTSCSRMMYAFARDGGLPFSKALSNVSVEHRVPTVSIWVSAALAFLSCIYGGAFIVLAAGCVVFLYISYIMPVAAGFFAEGKTWKEKGPFDLGVFSKPIAILAILGGFVLAWVGFQPPNQLVGYLVVGLLVFLLILWFASENKRFEGVPEGDRIKQRQKMIAEIEKKYKD
ncbi:MAG: amino acid permease [Chloroflexi bacterium]|nr:amino acid permease [Chloroflexota bacterium]